MPKTTSQIALIGTGLMGAPMARRLLAAGLPLRVWNRDITKAETLVAAGATLAASASEAARGCSHVITMLTDGSVVAQALFKLGVADALDPGATLIDMSSIKPSEARNHANQLMARGVAHLDAPVSGGTHGAETGTLAIMAGGDAAAFAGAAHVFAPMGRAVRVGPDGVGQLCKLANQAIVGVAIGAVAEATLLVREGDGDLTAFRAALAGGFADSIILQQHGRRMEEHDFKPGGRCSVQVKDLDNVLAEARSFGITLPLVQIIRDRFVRMMATHDGGDLDHSALFLDLLDVNGLQR